MSTTFKVVLDKRRANSKGHFPVRLRIYQGAEYKDFTPNISIPEPFWNDSKQKILSSYQDSYTLNDSIDGHKSRLKKLLRLHEIEGKADPSLHEIILFLKRVNNAPKTSPSQSIIRYGLELAVKLEKAGKIGNSIVYNTAINRLRKHVKSDDFSFTDLTFSLLDDCNRSMLSESLSVNAISNYLRTIRAIYNRAIKERIVSSEAYPFSNFTIRNQKTKSRSLTLEELRTIITKDLPQGHLESYRDLFLLSFCIIGINFADLLTLSKSDIIDGRLVFQRKKTHKIYSIKIQQSYLRNSVKPMNRDTYYHLLALVLINYS